MKRLILTFNRRVSGCCPGHDNYPNEKYKNNLSTKARSRHIKKEHKYVRTLQERELFVIINEMHLENKNEYIN